MKAWIVSKKYGYCGTIVFAETRGKAKSIALGTEPLEDAEFCSIEAKRAPEMDKYYKEGKTYMEWYDPEDRVAMVKRCKFHLRIHRNERVRNMSSKGILR